MVKQSRFLGGGKNDGSLEVSRPEYSGCITSREHAESVGSVPVAETRVATCCYSVAIDEQPSESSVVHSIATPGRKHECRTFCGKPVTHPLPNLKRSEAWGKGGLNWCANCGRKMGLS